MTKAELVTIATDRGLAVYRKDTAADIVARINADIRAKAELAAALARPIARLARYATRRVYRKAPGQIALPLAMPRDWFACCGRIASERYGHV